MLVPPPAPRTPPPAPSTALMPAAVAAGAVGDVAAGRALGLVADRLGELPRPARTELATLVLHGVAPRAAVAALDGPVRRRPALQTPPGTIAAGR